MNSSGLKMESQGFLSLIQDQGRFGVGHLGLSQGGALDLHSYFWANKLLDNPPNASVIEISLGGASFTAQQNMTLALCGANMLASIDGVEIKVWRSFQLLKGQTLNFGYASQGVRAYLAVKNGFAAPGIFNSQATVIRNQLGGLACRGHTSGMPLAEGNIIPVNPSCFCPITSQVPQKFQKQYPHQIELDLIESYQEHWFSKQTKQKFYQGIYQVSLQSDRMGVQLTGPQILLDRHDGDNDMISEPIAAGSVQITNKGQPIVLLNDRQTLGGYPKIGCISKLSQNKLAQARPDDCIRFHSISLTQATKNWMEFINFFRA